MDLRQLRALIAVVDEGTFTDAAAVLGVSQAAVSRSIAALERVLGVRLLNRTTRHVALTETGRKVLAQARRVLDEVAHLEHIVAASRAEVRVGYAWAALGRHTRGLQKRWASAHPDVPLIFVHANEPTAGLRDGTADVAVLRTPLNDPRFREVEVGRERRVVAMATEHPLARRRTLRLTDLARYPIAIDERTGTTTPEMWPADARPRVIRRTGSVDEWLTTIAANQAVGVTPEATAQQNPRPGVAYRALRGAPPITVRLAWRADSPPTGLDELIAAVRRLYEKR
ncbi:LysR family transcriptional regulator [Actinoplanes sp. NPDC051470]|uniref:LysR family transcriptional regulator n=1 Tax=Actinoplanes sp. NPDC051470 TaxID=3157224 RepID=UPI003424DA36